MGCDLQPVAEVEDAVARFGARYLDRVYTDVEQADAADAAGRPRADSLAARFAAKEAVLKLVGRPDGVDLRSVAVSRDPQGRPVVRLHDEVEERARRLGIRDVDLSLSHAGGLAMAVAVATCSTPHHHENPEETRP